MDGFRSSEVHPAEQLSPPQRGRQHLGPPKVRTHQGLIRLDGIVTDFDSEYGWVQVMILSLRKSPRVMYERLNLNAGWGYLLAENFMKH